jgi:putative ABC transport system substrate-binding protein
MKRRNFIGFAAGVAAAVRSPVTAAQLGGKMPRVGYLALTSTGQPGHIFFRQSLRELGYVEGKNIMLLEKFADGNDSRLPALAAELVADNVDAIVATSPPSIRAARDATQSVPIVMITGDDPVRSGYVASLARPGGNITGVLFLVVALLPKQMELLKELIPEIKRAAILWDPAMPTMTQDLSDVRAAAPLLGLQLQVVEARGAVGDYESAFAAMSGERVEALVIVGSPTFIQDRSLIISLAARYRLPAIYSAKDDVLAGGLISYGSGQAETIRLAVGYVDRILKGAKPADLPVERPTKFELVVNLRTATALGLTVPPAALARADEVIE